VGDKIYGFNRNGKDLYFDVIEKSSSDAKNSQIKFSRRWFTSDEIGSFNEGNKSVLRENLEFVKNYDLPEDLFKNEGRIFMLNKDYVNELLSDTDKYSQALLEDNITDCNKQ
tara:strand:+ start:186 stop:521 length:336 start_codon:yes stop_codon:yes gene_type:complete